MRADIKTGLLSLYRDFALRTGITARTMFGVYDYMFDPQQLRFIMDCIQETSGVAGCCVEAGCAAGHTTVFLKKWMNAIRLEKAYFALDTFSGFVPNHAEYEVRFRGKPSNIRDLFTLNKKEWFDYSLKISGVSGVVSRRVDVAEFDFSSIAPISFCLLDVDLYLPIQKSLPNIYRVLSPGGIIIVDDCKSDTIYDGALEAYKEFVDGLGIPQKIEFDKLGFIRKPAV
jgi:O-methyltransferase